MNQWINFHALWQIVVVGLLCGAGLPAVFAIGLRALELGTAPVAAGPASGSNPSGAATATTTARPTPAAMLAAGVCFAIVIAAIVWGIYLIVQGS